MPAPIQVQTPRVRVDLDGTSVPGAGPEHLLDVDFVAGAALQLAARHVADVRMCKSATKHDPSNTMSIRHLSGRSASGPHAD